MTPLEKAVEAYDNATLGTAEAHVRRIITAFLEAAAEDTDACKRVYLRFSNQADVYVRSAVRMHAGKAAILALKEAVG